MRLELGNHYRDIAAYGAMFCLIVLFLEHLKTIVGLTPFFKGGPLGLCKLQTVL